MTSAWESPGGVDAAATTALAGSIGSGRGGVSGRGAVACGNVAEAAACVVGVNFLVPSTERIDADGGKLAGTGVLIGVCKCEGPGCNKF